ncbi:tyrosine-protein kinase SRK2-like isoform X3 [Symsagittifera roscoffensis]|uniref:tyrosine-protein kinase SRK2-like isoform X3 n=1 Tax=Symsagittifera roscoffensis TaxID=84072 RepID=UPI00307CAB3F
MGCVGSKHANGGKNQPHMPANASRYNPIPQPNQNRYTPYDPHTTYGMQQSAYGPSMMGTLSQGMAGGNRGGSGYNPYTQQQSMHGGGGGAMDGSGMNHPHNQYNVHPKMSVPNPYNMQQSHMMQGGGSHHGSQFNINSYNGMGGVGAGGNGGGGDYFSPHANATPIAPRQLPSNQGHHPSSQHQQQHQQPPPPPRPQGSSASERSSVYTAIYPHHALDPGELSFEKGDKFLVLKADGPWWQVTCLKNNQTGYVPANFLSNTERDDWFFGAISRRDAEQLLNAPGVIPGTFLIRKRETCASGYSLSMRDDKTACMDNVKHYKIKLQEQDNKYFITAKIKFSTLKELVAHYQTDADGLVCALTKPCLMPAPQITSLAHTDHWEFPRERITFFKKLGHGQFGEVWSGQLKFDGGTVEVAIKTLKPNSMSAEAFLKEANIMKELQHKNLLKLHCVCTKEEPVYIITELMKCSLLEFLKDGEGKNITMRAQIEMSANIAEGMAYLESKNYIHRDLAARNVLVGFKYECKIADFGLARYTNDDQEPAQNKANKFPIKWTAPEAALMGRFTIKSDVWSFGILLAEIATKGKVPYPMMTNKEVLDKVNNGYRMPRPQECPEKLYGEVMLKCWHANPNKRPTFAHLFAILEDFNIATESSYNDDHMSPHQQNYQ